ncbi:T9SS type A sorting domain-containing protein [Flavobacterium sp.]|uniref:T9SS type A sorting domain-containing protein n=1 Tax=Flavobacterium sp. TaxID=239 RepID=UPI003752BAF1
MKLKITLLLTLLSCAVFAQQKSTGLITLSTNMAASLTLDNSTSQVTLTLTGPNDRWFALQFGSFTGGMQAGTDVVYWNNVSLVDAIHNGVGIAPSVESANDWIVISNTNNSPSAGLRTLIYRRAFNTGDSNDYTFNYGDNNIDLAWARSNTAVYSLAYHGATNRGVLLDIATTLGVDKFSLNNSQVYPNPTSGDFTVKTQTYLTKVNVYTIIGAFVKTIEVEDNAENAEVNIKGLSTGIYMIELQNDTEKSWKKVIVK